MKPLLKPILPEEPATRPQWAIDEIRDKPKLKAPKFADASRQEPKQGALAKRFAELKKRKAVPAKIKWLENIIKRGRR